MSFGPRSVAGLVAATVLVLGVVVTRAGAQGAIVASAAAGGSLGATVVGVAATSDGQGYWLVEGEGGVTGLGDAQVHGSLIGTELNDSLSGVAATPDGGGYWLVGRDGGVFAFGDAPYLGSMATTRLAAPVVGVAATPDGRGYWLVGADGGVFAFGDAPYRGRAPEPDPSAVRVGLFGDSLSWEAAPYFTYVAGTVGVQVEEGVLSGAAVCDALPDIAADAGFLHLRAAVLQFSGNAFTPCMTGYVPGSAAFFAKYHDDTVEAIRLLTDAGAHVFLAGSPPASTALGSQNLEVLNQMDAALASQYPNVTYVDAGRAVTVDGAFTSTLPCLAVEPCLGQNGTNVVRAPDGVHFCPDGRDAQGRCLVYSSGAFRYAMAMLGPVLDDLGV